MDQTWGINSDNQKVPNFTNKGNLKVLEIGPGKGLLLDRIINIYGKDNFYGMQPKNNEYNEYNNQLKEKLGDKFIEFSLEEYVELDDFIKFDIVYIYKININCNVKEKFIESLSKILNKDGIIYITSVEKERFHKYNDYMSVLWLRDDLDKYFKTEIGIERVGNEYYGYCILKLK